MQAPIYSRSADFSGDERQNVGGRSTVRTDQVNAELDMVAVTLLALCQNLALIQRDDGKLRDGLIELFQLSPTARAALGAKWNPAGVWGPLISYSVGDMVDVNGSAYVCAIAHISSIFAADYALGRWQAFIPLQSAAGLSFTPTATVLATNVQAAISEVDTKLRQAATPQLAAFYGGL